MENEVVGAVLANRIGVRRDSPGPFVDDVVDNFSIRELSLAPALNELSCWQVSVTRPVAESVRLGQNTGFVTMIKSGNDVSTRPPVPPPAARSAWRRLHRLLPCLCRPRVIFGLRKSTDWNPCV